MTKLENYLADGANFQARATLMFLQRENWSKEQEVVVDRWENGREQGYVVSLRNTNHKQLNIAFFQHRISDEICAVKWQQESTNTLTIDNAKFGDVYKTNYDISHAVNYGEALNMAKWIIDQLKEHWMKTQ